MPSYQICKVYNRWMHDPHSYLDLSILLEIFRQNILLGDEEGEMIEWICTH